jgi:hypothetical protein
MKTHSFSWVSPTSGEYPILIPKEIYDFFKLNYGICNITSLVFFPGNIWINGEINIKCSNDFHESILLKFL